MGSYGIYLKLEIKRALKILPRFYAGAVVLIFFMGAIALLAGRVLYGDAVSGTIKVAVVMPAEEDLLAQKAVSMLASMESVGNICEFIELKEEEAFQQLEARRADAVLVIPNGFVEDIMSGINTPANVVFPEHQTIESMIFKELADAGARSLSVAQASIYAADQVCVVYGIPEAVGQVEREINQLYFNYTLPREEYFRSYQVSAVSEIGVLQHYAISAVVLCLMLSGIPLFHLYQTGSKGLVQKLKLIGIGRQQRIFASISASALLQLTVLVSVYVAALMSGGIVFEFAQLAWLPLAAVCISAFLTAVYQLVRNPMAYIMAVFWFTAVMLFIAGGIVPSVFLPDSLQRLAEGVPVFDLLELGKGFFGITVSAMTAARLMIWTVFFYLTAVAAGGER